MGTTHFIKAAAIREQRRPKRKSRVLTQPVLRRMADKALQVTNRTLGEGLCAQVQEDPGEIMGVKIPIARSSRPALDTNLLCGKRHAI